VVFIHKLLKVTFSTNKNIYLLNHPEIYRGDS
jgi:hypothetical protein